MILPPTPETQIEIDLDTRFSLSQFAQTQISQCVRFSRDMRGDSIVLGEYLYPGEPNGRIILFGRLVNCASQLQTITFTDVIISALGSWSGSEGEQRRGWPPSQELELTPPLRF